MANDWDLYAVVRSCAATNPVNIEDPLPDMASLTFQNDNDPFDFSALNTIKPFLGLEEIFNEAYAIPQPITPTPSIGGFENQQPTQASSPPPQQMIHHRRQIETEFEDSPAGSALALPTFHPRTLRPRRRCSTSKGCAARKQVERSISNPAIFVVSYTGEHTHPRPTHRNSQAGNIRTKFSAVHKPTSGDSSSVAPPATLPKPSCSSSSPVSVSSFSPSTPLTEGESAPHDDTQKETIEIEDEEDDEDEDLLIPNMAMAEDIFNGFQELKRGR
ncbi:hypothetical protein F0562_026662 [Nyssa sinensis]|uniref:WRKY domain-containing protein n=1 Tax=Nyssa sinensis TaxID=561372 RepID=A0A5J5BC40_9ASTE|nr:hypothetical protein F0562_026662 [Nyssa sinensis]